MSTPACITIQVPSACSEPCYDFTWDGENRSKVTVFLVPIAVNRLEEKTLQISWACSRGAFCADCECRYAKKNPRKFREEDSNIENLGTAFDR